MASRHAVPALSFALSTFKDIVDVGLQKPGLNLPKIYSLSYNSGSGIRALDRKHAKNLAGHARPLQGVGLGTPEAFRRACPTAARTFTRP